MNINFLRSQLQFCCSDELKNLTTVDLEECKWPVKKKIFCSVICYCPSLQEFHQELQDLIENHQSQINDITSQYKFKSSSTTSSSSPTPPLLDNSRFREKKEEVEMLFRTNFLRIVLCCLTKLRWPPALEAFSDPLTDLFHDSSVCHYAMDYMLKVGIPSSSLNDVKETISTNQTYEERLPRTSGRYKSRSILSGSSNSSNSNGNNSNSSSSSNISSNDSNSYIHLSIPSEVSVQNESKQIHGSIKSKLQSKSQLQSQSQLQVQTNSTMSSSSKDKSNILNNDGLIKSYEMLQAQNNYLRKQNKMLKEHVSIKLQAEEKMESILMEILQQFQSTPKSVASKPSQPYSLSKLITPEEDELFRRELEKEANYLRQLKSQDQPQSGNKSHIHVRKISTSSISSTTKSTTINESISSHFSRNQSQNQNQSQNIDQDKEIHSNRISKKVLESLIQQWKSVRKEAQQMALKPIGLSDDTSFLMDEYINHSDKLPYPSSAIDIKTGKLLGIKSVSSSSTKIASTYDMKDTWNHSQIQLIQKDLFHFAIHAMHVIENTINHYDSIDVNNRKSLDSLSIEAQNLLLHLSSISPLIPLSETESEIYSSTGLEDLLQEITSILHNIKGISKTSLQKLQKLSDRARCEQGNLVRSLESTRTHLSKWPQAIKYTQACVDNTRNKYSSALKKVMNYMDELRNKSEAILKAYEEASKTKISSNNTMLMNSSLSKSSTSSISSIEALLRGLLGEKVALLITSLQVYLDDVENVKSSVENLRQKLHDSIIDNDTIFSELDSNIQHGLMKTNKLLISPITVKPS